MIPDDHTFDEKILFGILDKDRDGVFSFEDFVRNFPKYDSAEVETFMANERKRMLRVQRRGGHCEDSDPFENESSVSLSSIDSE